MSYFFRYSVDTLTSSQTDPTITNSWGVVIANDTIWVSHAVGGDIGRYNLNGTRKGKDIALPTDRMGANCKPSGMVENFTTNFGLSIGGITKGAFLLIAGLNGVIMAYNPLVDANNGFIVVDRSADIIDNPPVYTGITVGDEFLYAVDFHNKRIDVFNSNFQAVPELDLNPTRFVDPSMPDRMSPFNAVNIGGFIFVLYTLQKDQFFPQGAGDGYINVFNQDGVLLRRFVSRGVLEAPWAMLYTPNCFGFPLGALLVGNQKNGRINAFDRQGNHLGYLIEKSGNPVQIPGLWGLAKASQTTDSIYFAAGPIRETTGLFGRVTRILRLPRFYNTANPSNVNSMISNISDNSGINSTNVNLIDVGNNPALRNLIDTISESGVLNNYSLNDVLKNLIKSGKLNSLGNALNNSNCGPNGCTNIVNNLEIMEALRNMNGNTTTNGCCGTRTCKPSCSTNRCPSNNPLLRGLQISNGDGTYRNIDPAFLQSFDDGSLLDLISNPAGTLGNANVDSETSTTNLLTRLASNIGVAGMDVGGGFNKATLLQYLINCGIIRQCDPCDPCCNPCAKPNPCKKSSCSTCPSSSSNWSTNTSWSNTGSNWGNTGSSWGNSDPWNKGSCNTCDNE